MKINKHVLRIAVLSTVFALGIGFTVNFNTPHKEVVAEQHAENYAPYTYSGNYYTSKNIDFNAGDGMNGALRTYISTQIRPAGFFTYSGSKTGALGSVLQTADQDPINSNNMVMFYTRNSVTKVDSTTDAINWDREHVWCQDHSNGNWGTDKGGVDVLHLRPTYPGANRSRGNKKYGDVNKANPGYIDPSTKEVTNDSTKLLFGYSNNTYFEPLDCVKGDVARIIMYLWTAYTGYPNYNPLNILDIFSDYNTLIQWHTQDRPDVSEGNRNDYAQNSKQQNRNPFVDHPELAWKIFSDAPNLSSSVKNACMTAYPGSGSQQITPTGITLNTNTASVSVGNTAQLSATLEPSGATGSITWTSSDTDVVTVSNTGLVTGVAVGTATITASVSQNISAQCTVNVTGPLQYTKVASYDFSSGNSSTSEYNTSTLLSRFNSSVVTGQNLSNIVTSVTETSKTYAGYANYYNFGLKLGTSSNNGSFTLSLSKDVSRVIVKTAGWGTGDTLTVGDATGQIPGVAYDGSNPIKALTYDITESDNVTFSYAKRGFIQSIDFYSSEETEDAPINYLSTNNTFATIYGIESSSEQEGTTNFVFSQMGYDSGAAFSEDQVEDVTVTANKASGSTTPAYYSTGTALRLYGGNTLTLTAPTNITSIQFTINYGDDSRLSSNVGTYASSAWTGESNSVTFTMSGTSGHIRIQTIAVTYTKSVSTVATPFLRFGTTISKTNWDAIAAKWSIDNCGVMLVKETTLQNTYHEDSIADAYSHDKNLAINYVNLSLLPSYDESNYMISVRIDMTDEAYRGITYCASPFIVIDDVYYFLGEIHSSFNDTLDDCIDHDGKSELSHDALLSLKTNQN